MLEAFLVLENHFIATMHDVPPLHGELGVVVEVIPLHLQVLLRLGVTCTMQVSAHGQATLGTRNARARARLDRPYFKPGTDCNPAKLHNLFAVRSGM